jgi:hypothetical protein
MGRGQLTQRLVFYCPECAEREFGAAHFVVLDGTPR